MQESLHDHLTGHRADRGRRQPRGEQRNPEHGAGERAEQRPQCAVRFFDAGDVHQALAVEGGCGHDKHRRVNDPGQAHRDDDVDDLEAE